jgi:hypothetical protein
MQMVAKQALMKLLPGIFICPYHIGLVLYLVQEL